MRNSENRLTPKQERFCEEYIIDLNATQAAVRAGYSKSTANEQGARLLVNVSVQSKIQGLMNDRASRIRVDADAVLQELSKIAFRDIGKAYNTSGQLLPIQEMPDDVRRSISSFEIGEGTGEGTGKRVSKVRFTDRLRALELIGKHLKLFTDKVEHSGGMTLEQLVLGSMREEKTQS